MTDTWQPHQAARERAAEFAQYVDIDMHVVKYRLRCHERGVEPSSTEWLRWFIEDEQRERTRTVQAEKPRRRKWYHTAGDE